MASDSPSRNLLGRFRPAPAAPGLISSLQAYGGLQAWAARAHRLRDTAQSCAPSSQLWKRLYFT